MIEYSGRDYEGFYMRVELNNIYLGGKESI